MKFVRFVNSHHPKGTWGVISADGKIDLIKGSPFKPVEKTGEVVDEGELVRYLPPLDPPNVFAIGRNYVEHAAETHDDMPSSPLTFSKATSCLIGHGDSIVIPAVAPDQVDYEAELVAIIGKTARKISESEALDYVFGYTCGNDVSARDCQASDNQWTRAKSFDTFGPVGPYLVTDLDPADLTIRMRLNGETMQEQSTKDMAFSVAHIVSFLSQAMTLLPGTMIFTGTPCGVGIGRNPPVFLKAGDVCEVEVDGIGTLRNSVVEDGS